MWWKYNFGKGRSVKKRLFMVFFALSILSLTISSWVKHLTKIEDFDIFGDIEDEEEL